MKRLGNRGLTSLSLRKIQGSELAKEIFGGLVVLARRFFRRVTGPDVALVATFNSHDKPAALNEDAAIWLMTRAPIPGALRRRAEPDIAASIVESVPVDVIDPFIGRRAEDDAMHPDIFPGSICARVMSVPALIRVPAGVIDKMDICRVYEREQPTRQGNAKHILHCLTGTDRDLVVVAIAHATHCNCGGNVPARNFMASE